MRGITRYIWRLSPTKSLITVFLLAMLFLNWSNLMYYENLPWKPLTGKDEDPNTSEYIEQFKSFIRKGFTVVKIIESRENRVIIQLIKRRKDKLQAGSIQYENPDIKLDVNALGDKDGHSTKQPHTVQSDWQAHRNDQSNSMDEIEAKIPTSDDVSDKLDVHPLGDKSPTMQSDWQAHRNDQSNSMDEIEAKIPTSDDVTDRCPNNTLGHVDMISYGRCKPHQPTIEGCKEAHRLYYYDPKPCDPTFQGDICTLSVHIKNVSRMLRARCNRSLCLEGRRHFSVKMLNPDTGMHDMIRSYSTFKQLELRLPSILKSNHAEKNNYVFLQCKGKDNLPKFQLLPIDPRYTLQENKATPRHKNRLNVNIVLIDSVARDHFYRSLPKTIQTFKRLAKTPTSPMVFDFELFQAVEGHTAENTHALFTGSLFPPTEDRDAIRPVGMEKFFGTFKRAGYQTMWQEDLCWEGQWGLTIDLAIPFSWSALVSKLKDVFIDHTGITHSSCEILKTYNLISPFEKPKDKICYNGKYQHTYFLDYIEANLQAISQNANALPLLSYTMLSVAHDMHGRRIQSMDQDLSRFVERMSKESCTLTVVLADHGNTYTSYTVTSQEGKFEMFHPSLFMIVPHEVGKLLGTKALEALYENQRRLLTIIDLHHSLMALAVPISPKGVEARGLFRRLPSNRTCSDVELRTPNMCVCEGWDSPTTNDTLKLAYAEFATGELNNMLMKQGRGLPLFRSCQRLQPSRFENVRVRNKNTGELVTSMDLVVPAGDSSTKKEDIFHVEIESKHSDKDSINMKLSHYERLTPYGVYSTCADKGVNKKLCVCSKGKNHMKRKGLKLLVNKQSKHFHSKAMGKVLDDDESECLLLIRRIHGKMDARAYEIANTCADQSRSVEVTISDVYNMKISRDGPINVVVPPGSIVFLFSAMKQVQYYKGDVKVEAYLKDY
ncbi:uncharacterized protein LOC110232882 [Exaiptasia diaphana]|uniref:Uncharacterized protein n=1 Tax=Exaiptasia diaphana TaxID=2652724 RepID=A0A913WT69_EXADI|nr:uncharacterized protein LOC110232882 [Exaiptasia diaphana]XP_028513070.1 uncharacterized protein LOC110232882 [Exaiptasia diaphana]XP_028513071.1 uncharacterized protein LOC110232882 [Exaiptasia diaphana]KXJ27905.1 hypothetical protein AC249_AIPGENE2939 [Exaiptasia diaphana]